MTQITISLTSGNNYISFPAISTENFGTLLSGIATYITPQTNGKKSFFKYDPIPIVSQNYWADVNDDENIEKGRGYLITMTSPADLIYDGFEYNLTFDQIKSKLMAGLTGWNLVGPGYETLSPPNWCRIIDPITGFPVTQIFEKKAYWIYYYDCTTPTIDPLVFIFSIGLVISIISLYLSLKSKKTETDENII